ncbi:Hypothetical predicted protein [Octopus vulgaris]|uniref:Uncharacterized protein n=1 Tax=Octopus vulgaris TaxID=6645 RepID=A0AA36FGM7_OCTVU|nr:Hypothetical predicted protein [Octopus vulgaris]
MEEYQWCDRGKIRYAVIGKGRMDEFMEMCEREDWETSQAHKEPNQQRSANIRNEQKMVLKGILALVFNQLCLTANCVIIASPDNVNNDSVPVMALLTKEHDDFSVDINGKSFESNNTNTAANFTVTPATHKTEIQLFLEPTTKEQTKNFSESSTKMERTKRWVRSVLMKIFSPSRNFTDRNYLEVAPDNTVVPSEEVFSSGTTAMSTISNSKVPLTNIMESSDQELTTPVYNWTTTPRMSLKKVVTIWTLCGISITILIIILSVCLYAFCG